MVGYVKSLGAAQATTPGSTLTIAVTDEIAAGETLILRLAHPYTTGGPTATDTRSNTYTRVRTAGTAGASIGPPIVGFRNSTFVAQITSQLHVGDTITVTTSISVTERIVRADWFTGLTGTVDAQNGWNSTGLGIGDGTTVTGTYFTTLAAETLVINAFYAQQDSAALYEITPGYRELVPAGLTDMTLLGGWAMAFSAGNQSFNVKLPAGVKFQLQQISLIPAAPVGESASFTDTVFALGANSYYPLAAGGSLYTDAVRGSAHSAVPHGSVHTDVLDSPIFATGVRFDGSANNWVEIADNALFSAATTGELTVAAWMRPDTLDPVGVEGDDPATGDGKYLHWIGKGDTGRYEWLGRQYRKHEMDGVTLNNRPNRTSFYYFNADGGLGSGSYFQDALTAGEWIFVVATYNRTGTQIYRDGVARDADFYSDYGITPTHTAAPVRLGSGALQSWFSGAIGPVAFWNRKLTDVEVRRLYLSAGNASPVAPSSAGMYGNALYPAETLYPSRELWPSVGSPAPGSLVETLPEVEPPDLLDDLPPYEQGSYDIQGYVSAVGNELARLEAHRQALMLNYFPDSADALLGLFELMLGLPVSPPTMTLAERRRTVLAFMQGLKSMGSGLEWEASMEKLIGTGWSYQEHDPADPSSPPEYTIEIKVPYAQAAGVPSSLAATPTLGGGGSIAAGTYYYKVTAVTLYGETLPSPSVNATLSGTGKILVSWVDPVIPTITGFNVYRGATGGGVTLLDFKAANSPGTSSNSYSDTGSRATGSQPPPLTDTSGSPQAYKVEQLARRTVPAHLDIVVGYQAGFVLGVSHVGEEPM